MTNGNNPRKISQASRKISQASHISVASNFARHGHLRPHSEMDRYSDAHDSDRESQATKSSRQPRRSNISNLARPKTCLGRIPMPNLQQRNLNSLDATQVSTASYCTTEDNMYIMKAALSPNGDKMLRDKARKFRKMAEAANGCNQLYAPASQIRTEEVDTGFDNKSSTRRCDMVTIDDVFDWEMPLKELVRSVAAFRDLERKQMRMRRILEPESEDTASEDSQREAQASDDS